MFYNLAIKNVLRSLKDYFVYFITLTFGVCVFYVFNSMGSQSIMLDFTAKQSQMVSLMLTLLEYVSIFVVAVLAGLVLYANNFILRRRKREFGLYMIMGIQRRKISMMLLVEAAAIGVLSLVAGLALGILCSQMLCVVASKIYHVAVINYHFVISKASLVKTLLNFAMIFLIVAVLNIFSISKSRLINLVHSNKHNEGTFITRHIWVSVLLFVVAVVLLGTAYAWICKIKLYELGMKFLLILIMGCVGTLLFFLSLSGFALKLMQVCKGIYYKNLNMFVLRQLTSKMGSNFASMAMVCLMLFITIGALGSAIGMSQAVNDHFRRSTPFDASFIWTVPGDESCRRDILDKAFEEGNEFQSLYSQHYSCSVYATQTPFRDLMVDYSRFLPDHKVKEYNEPSKRFTAVSIEDYNACMRMAGLDEIILSDNQLAVFSTFEPCVDVFTQAEKDGAQLTIAGTALAIGPVVQQNMYTDDMMSTEALLIIPQSVVDTLKPRSHVLVADYVEGLTDAEEKNEDFYFAMSGRLFQQEEDVLKGSYIRYMTKSVLYDDNIATYGTVMFIGIYIGLVFLIACAATLSIQQLSQASDDQERYRLLRKIGTDEKIINSALTKQIALYFLLPLVLAALHSWVGLYVVVETLASFGSFNIPSTIFFILFFLIVIYGGYFLATCWGARSIVRERAQP